MPRFDAALPMALTVVGLYAGYCLLLFIFQRALVFPGVGISDRAAANGDVSQRQTIWLDISFGRVESWYFPAVQMTETETKIGDAAGRTPAVLIAHGNAELIDHVPLELRRFTELGVAVLLVEYPGYGDSQGTPTENSVTETFVTAYDLLAARPEIDSGRIIALGRSLGGGAVCALAARRPLRGLILLSSFTSLRSMASSYLVPGFLSRDPFDNLRVLRDFSGPVLILHGTADRVIPPAHGERLAAVTDDSRLIYYPCGHNDCPSDWNVFWRDVVGFLDRAGLR